MPEFWAIKGKVVLYEVNNTIIERYYKKESLEEGLQ